MNKKAVHILKNDKHHELQLETKCEIKKMKKKTVNEENMQ